METFLGAKALLRPARFPAPASGCGRCTGRPANSLLLSRGRADASGPDAKAPARASAAVGSLEHWRRWRAAAPACFAVCWNLSAFTLALVLGLLRLGFVLRLLLRVPQPILLLARLAVPGRDQVGLPFFSAVPGPGSWPCGAAAYHALRDRPADSRLASERYPAARQNPWECCRSARSSNRRWPQSPTAPRREPSLPARPAVWTHLFGAAACCDFI